MANSDVPEYKHLHDVMTLKIPSRADFRIESNWGYTVRVYDVELTDYPGGGKAVSIEGLHIKKDSTPGSHRRTGRWEEGQILPAKLAALVEDARPGWWPTAATD